MRPSPSDQREMSRDQNTRQLFHFVNNRPPRDALAPLAKLDIEAIST